MLSSSLAWSFYLIDLSSIYLSKCFVQLTVLHSSLVYDLVFSDLSKSTRHVTIQSASVGLRDKYLVLTTLTLTTPPGTSASHRI